MFSIIFVKFMDQKTELGPFGQRFQSFRSLTTFIVHVWLVLGASNSFTSLQIIFIQHFRRLSSRCVWTRSNDGRQPVNWF